MAKENLFRFTAALTCLIASATNAALVVDIDNAGDSGGGLDAPVVQTFIPNQNSIAGVDAFFFFANSATSDATLRLWADPLREGSPLVEATAPGIADGSTPIEFRWDPFAITPGETYFLEFIDFGTRTIAVRGNDPYPDGAVIEGGGNLFNGTLDASFRTFYDDEFVIPLPAVAWLFPAGLLAGLGWMRRQRA